MNSQNQLLPEDVSSWYPTLCLQQFVFLFNFHNRPLLEIGNSCIIITITFTFIDIIYTKYLPINIYGKLPNPRVSVKNTSCIFLSAQPFIDYKIDRDLTRCSENIDIVPLEGTLTYANRITLHTLHLPFHVMCGNSVFVEKLYNLKEFQIITLKSISCSQICQLISNLIPSSCLSFHKIN